MYIQLVLLTPALFRLLDHSFARAVLYAVTPATLAVRCALALASISAPMQAFCGSWLVFYLLGLEWRGRVAPWLGRRGIGAGRVLVALSACLVLQWAGGLWWLSRGSFDMATTQLKLSSMLTSCCAVALVALAGGRARRRLAGCRPLVRLGDLSFGVFLCHIAFVAVWGKLSILDGPVDALAGWAFSLVCSCVLISACRKLLPEGMLCTIGFS